MYFYQQQSFLINSNNELLLEQTLEENTQIIEETIPIIYEQFYSELKSKKTCLH